MTARDERTTRPARGSSRWLLALAVALATALVGSLWIVDYLPTGDGANHVLAGFLTGHLHDAGRGYDAFLEPGGAVSSLAFHALFSGLEQLLPWRDALRVTLSLGALVWAFGFAYVATALAPKRVVVGLLGFGTALSWTLYMGLFSYWIALGLDLAVLGFALRRRTWRWRDRLVLGAALAILMFAHSFAAGLLGLMLGVVVLVRGSARGRWRELGALALVSAPALLVAVLSARGASRFVEPNAAAGDLLGATWLGLRDRLDILWQCFTGGPAWRGMIPLALALAGLASLAMRARRGRASRDELAVGLIAVLMLVAVVTTPIHLNMWRDLAPRFLPLGASLGLALLPVEELARPAARALAAAAVIAFAAASIGWSWVHHRALARASADALAVAAEPLHRAGPRLPIVLVPPEGSVAQVDEKEGIGNLFAVEQGGMTPYLYALRPGLHPFVWQRPRSELFPRMPPRFYGDVVRAADLDPRAAPREVHLTWLAMLGAAYEDVILWGTPADLDAFETRGYEADARRGGAGVLRFAPCTLTVVLEAPDAPAAPPTVAYGWAPLTEAAGERTVGEPEAYPRRARFPEAPCGPVWIRGYWDDDGSGDASPGDSFCALADDEGRLHVELARTRHTIRCRRVRRAALRPSGQ
ncbi:MAG: hypothetical protein HY908_05155 [Myxococcales bacterium]|nr:hypothetical protein [Myxococcales bacterium]